MKTKESIIGYHKGRRVTFGCELDFEEVVDCLPETATPIQVLKQGKAIWGFIARILGKDEFIACYTGVKSQITLTPFEELELL